MRKGGKGRKRPGDHRVSGTEAPVLRTRLFSTERIALALLVVPALSSTLASCGGKNPMLEQMRAISRRTEEIQAAIEIDTPTARKRIASRAVALLQADWLADASADVAWRGILRESIDAARVLATTDSRDEARAAHKQLEASCWRCHDRYVDRHVTWARR